MPLSFVNKSDPWFGGRIPVKNNFYLTLMELVEIVHIMVQVKKVSIFLWMYVVPLVAFFF